jgi:hypothetical protein
MDRTHLNPGDAGHRALAHVHRSSMNPRLAVCAERRWCISSFRHPIYSSLVSSHLRDRNPPSAQALLISMCQPAYMCNKLEMSSLRRQVYIRMGCENDHTITCMRSSLAMDNRPHSNDLYLHWRTPHRAHTPQSNEETPHEQGFIVIVRVCDHPPYRLDRFQLGGPSTFWTVKQLKTVRRRANGAYGLGLGNPR